LPKHLLLKLLLLKALKKHLHNFIVIYTKKMAACLAAIFV
jgi:hypothetical protein